MSDYTHGKYTATLHPQLVDQLFVWNIERDGVLVGCMYEGGMYDRPYALLTKLLWAGPFPLDCTSPKSPNYGIHFDIGPQPTREECLAKFVAAADRLIAWRAAQKEQS
jgi:hypothetical protein